MALLPDSATVPRGGTLGYKVRVTNSSSSSQTFKYWTYVEFPNGNRYPATGELFGPVTITLAAGQSRTVHPEKSSWATANSRRFKPLWLIAFFRLKCL
ncbi:MAG: hypothetical protein HZA16_10515 [Nitrospirae bacterium]|nr:hypothetical protein [Nitrospirota bacterium]